MGILSACMCPPAGNRVGWMGLSEFGSGAESKRVKFTCIIECVIDHDTRVDQLYGARLFIPFLNQRQIRECTISIVMVHWLSTSEQPFTPFSRGSHLTALYLNCVIM